MPKSTIDFAWVKKVEGGSLKKPYVPVCTAKSISNSNNINCFGKPLGSIIGKSGITVAAGFDMGQHSLYDLKNRYKFPDNLIAKMTPFLKPIKGEKSDPREILSKNKHIEFTDSDIKLIDNTVKNLFLKELKAKYSKETGKRFEDLPANIQTAIFSAVYNYGLNSVNSEKILKLFWVAIKDGNWKAAAEILSKKKVNNSRRIKEAELLTSHLKDTPEI